MAKQNPPSRRSLAFFLGLGLLLASRFLFGFHASAQSPQPDAGVLNNTIFLPLVRNNIQPSPTPTFIATAPATPIATDQPPTTGAEWPMVAANPQRTSWTPEEVRGNLNVAWYHPLEPYIPYKIQPIAANGKIYVTTARGLYAFNAANGNLDWVYPTEVPLGNAPTVATVNGTSIAYVGGYDRQIHAVNALTGQMLWTTNAADVAGGFDANPLVIQDAATNNAPLLVVGNRDGFLYAFDATNGQRKWRFQTNGPLLFSAAYKNGIVYIASNDTYAYAVKVSTGAQVWKSAKLPGTGFFSYWPVIYTDKATGKDYVIFTGGSNYRAVEFWQPQTFETPAFKDYNLPSNRLPLASAPVSGDWVAGTAVLDASVIADYLAKHPADRTSFVLDAATGAEFTYTANGQQSYAPFNYSGVTRGGSKYPPIINGVDGVYYQQTAYASYDHWVDTGAPVGWKFGTPYISEISDWTQASDEPVAFSSGGRILYWTLCCDRFARGYDVTIPLGQPNRSWIEWNYSLGNPDSSIVPGYGAMYNDGYGALVDNIDGWQIYSGKNQSKNGIYGKHGMAQSPVIPYLGRLYALRGNALIAFSPTGAKPKTPLPLATVVPVQSQPTSPTPSDLKQRLEAELQKMLAAGHLRPGYYSTAFADQYSNGSYLDERGLGEILDYFANPADTVYTLLLAYPQVSAATQQQIKNYLQTFYGPGAPYDVTQIVHVGWENGADRAWSNLPAATIERWQTYQYGSPWLSKKQPICGSCGYWHNFVPFNFYAAWKYAQVIGNNDPNLAKSLFDAMRDKVESPPADPWLINKPYFINLYAAGYLGYLQLKQLAGLGGDATVQGHYDHMLALRVNNFAKDIPYWGDQPTNIGNINYNRTLSLARNFMFLTPEIAAYMNQQLKTQVQIAVDEYNDVGPYWFVNGFDAAVGEGTLSSLYNPPALFQAKAYILRQPYSELVKYLDVPAFDRGDLFYIQNLVAALDAPNATGQR